MTSTHTLLYESRLTDFQEFMNGYKSNPACASKLLEIDGTTYVLTPGFLAWVKERFESRYNYGQFLEEAQSLSRIVDDGAAGGLRQSGYQVVQAMAPEAARKWHDAIHKETSIKPNHKRFKVSSIEINRRRETMLGFAEDLITEELEHLITQFFQSHFYIMFMHFNRVIPFDHADDVEDVSFKWHVDADVPEAYLKFLFMLNGFEEHEGGTSFLDKETTARLDEVGYARCGGRHRVEDLAPLCRHYDIPFEPEFVKPNAGQGVLFQPINVLHKGMAPAKGPRVGGQIAFIPHPRPWRETFKNNLQNVRQMRDGVFPRVVMAN